MGQVKGEKRGQEIEQRYLVKYLPPDVLAQITKKNRSTINPQAYLSETTRIRRIRDPHGTFSYYKTIKIPEHGDGLPDQTSVKDETETQIEATEFQKKLRFAKNKISKRRYHVDLGTAIPEGATVDFDVIRSWNILPWKSIRRRILVEVEFANLDQVRSFVPPDWFDSNVTNEISTRKLAKRSKKAVNTIRQSMKMPLFRG